MSRILAGFLAAGLTAACAAAPSPVADATRAGAPLDAAVADSTMPGAIVPFPHAVAWSAVPNLRIAGDGGVDLWIPTLFTRLEVEGTDSLGVRVSCAVCEPMIGGYVTERDLIAETLPPEIAAWGTFPEFLLSIRDAAARHDLEALRPVMTPEFTSSFFGIQNPDAAFATWQAEGYASLDELPALLDQGVATRDSLLWSTPPAFVADITYQGPRSGFRRRADGRWEWLYLVRGIADRR